MSNAHNMCAEVIKKDKRSPELKLFGKRVTQAPVYDSGTAPQASLEHQAC